MNLYSLIDYYILTLWLTKITKTWRKIQKWKNALFWFKIQHKWSYFSSCEWFHLPFVQISNSHTSWLDSIFFYIIVPLYLHPGRTLCKQHPGFQEKSPHMNVRSEFWETTYISKFYSYAKFFYYLLTILRFYCTKPHEGRIWKIYMQLIIWCLNM
jgi:hypothetical protein